MTATAHKTPYLMSVEETHGHATIDGYHLGTDERIARELVAERFHGRRRANMPVVTVALMDAKKKIIDVYDGLWSSERTF